MTGLLLLKSVHFNFSVSLALSLYLTDLPAWTSSCHFPLWAIFAVGTAAELVVVINHTILYELYKLWCLLLFLMLSSCESMCCVVLASPAHRYFCVSPHVLLFYLCNENRLWNLLATMIPRSKLFKSIILLTINMYLNSNWPLTFKMFFEWLKMRLLVARRWKV